MNDALRESLEQFIEKSIDIRFEFNTVEFGAGPVELHRALVESEEALTQLENYLSQSMRAKSLLERKAAAAKMEWQEAWDKAIAKVNRRPTLGEFATGKEKASEANLETFDETRKMRKAEEFLSFAVEAVDVIRLHYYGLDKIRQNIRKRLDMSQTDYFS